MQLVVPNVARYAAAALVPEATFTRLTTTCVPPRADVTVIGMGLGTGTGPELVLTRLLSGSEGRFVLDADALTVMAGWYGKGERVRPEPGREVVVTPHEGEAARLLGCRPEEVKANRLAAAKEIARRYAATVVLKGPATLVVSPDASRIYKNATGNPFMALGGVGDLLAGLIGARWAYLKGAPFEAAASAVWLHGAAADAIVAEGLDPSLGNIAAKIGAMRTALDRGAAI